MELFRIAIEETVINEFFIEASDKNDAIDIAIRKYEERAFDWDPDNIIVKQMAVVDLTSPTEWFKL